MSGKKHICPKCKKSFRDAYELRRHLKRKTPCVIDTPADVQPDDSENKCVMCGKTYASLYSLKRHQKDCDAINNPKMLLQIISQHDKQIALLQSQIAQNSLLPQTVINNNNTTINQVNQNMYVNVTFCAFGKEDLARLDTSKIMGFLKGPKDEFMSKMIEYIYANSAFPEFNNIVHDSVRKITYVLKLDEDNNLCWEPEDFYKISKELSNRIKNMVDPTVGPYFDMAMQAKDTETSNNIINIARHINWEEEKYVELNREVLSKLEKNEAFMKLVNAERI